MAALLLVPGWKHTNTRYRTQWLQQIPTLRQSIAVDDVKHNWILKHVDLISEFALPGDSVSHVIIIIIVACEIENCQSGISCRFIVKHGIDNWIYADQCISAPELAGTAFWSNEQYSNKLTNSQYRVNPWSVNIFGIDESSLSDLQFHYVHKYIEKHNKHGTIYRLTYPEKQRVPAIKLI